MFNGSLRGGKFRGKLLRKTSAGVTFTEASIVSMEASTTFTKASMEKTVEASAKAADGAGVAARPDKYGMAAHSMENPWC